MSLNRASHYLISTISDSPRNVFENIETFDSYEFGGLHFDVMDGIFVPRLGLHPELLREIRNGTEMFIEVHAMLHDPTPYLEVLAESGANRIIVHLESSSNISMMLRELRLMNVELGLALNPNSPLDLLIPYIEEIHTVMLMAINPGIPKHPFIESTFDKVSKLKSLVLDNNPHVKIGIDGGVTFSNHLQLLAAGADYLICGSGTIFNQNGSIEENIEKLLKL